MTDDERRLIEGVMRAAPPGLEGLRMVQSVRITMDRLRAAKDEQQRRIAAGEPNPFAEWVADNSPPPEDHGR